jgi:hypothetical protein
MNFKFVPDLCRERGSFMDKEFVNMDGEELEDYMSGQLGYAFEAEPEGWGLMLSLEFDPGMYSSDEALEIGKMCCQVIASWLRRREYVNGNPEQFGITVH